MSTPISSSEATSLTRAEAEQRAALVSVERYLLEWDLTRGAEVFGSRTTIRFTSGAGSTFLDVQAAGIESCLLDGEPIDPTSVRGGRLALDLAAGEHEVVVDATMAYRHDGEGMHRAVDPADDEAYLYLMCFMDAAPSAYACFDQPDLKAAYDVRVTAPAAWTIRGNGAVAQCDERGDERGDERLWTLARTAPISTYLVTLVAGPWHVVEAEHDGIALGLSARRSLADELDAQAEEILALTRQSFDELHRLFGIRYPFGQYHQAFVPEFNAGAMENAGCVLFRDPMVFTSRVVRDQRIGRATTIAHEMAHQWFGNLVTPRWWDDLWLNESFAEYAGTRVAAEATAYTDAWTNASYVRRPWGLMADRRPTTHPVAGEPGVAAPDAATALGDFDGISYAKGAAVLGQLAARDDDVFWRGVADHMDAHRFGNATLADLVGAWERAGAGDLSEFVSGWLRTAGPDTLRFDRAAGVVTCAPHAPGAPRRNHAISVATLAADGAWTSTPLLVAGDTTAHTAPTGPSGPVVLDPDEQTWALTLLDTETLERLPEVVGTTTPRLRASILNQVRSGFEEALVHPDLVLRLVAATTPTETDEDAVARVLPWVLREVVWATADPDAALQLVHEAASTRAETAEPGSTMQLAAVQGAVAAAGDVEQLRRWLAGTAPAPGVEVDLDLRWRMLRRLATLGAVEIDELDAALEADRTAQAVVAHAGARASMPRPDAKQWAWQVFTGEVEVTNYELEAAGAGMWHPDQTELTEPYAAAYLERLPGTATHRSGWMLAQAARAFFPATSLEPATLEAARALAADESLAPALARTLLDSTDSLARRLAVREAFGGRR